MADKIMLLDGHSLLNRAFYGLPDLTNAEGKHTNAVLGFLNIMLRYVEEEKPTHLLVAFDRKEPTFRHIKYKEYNLKKELFNSIYESIQNLIKIMGIIIFFKIILDLLMTKESICYSLLKGLVEVTTGLNDLVNFNISIKIKEIISYIIISFMGLSIQMQMSIILEKYNIDYKYFYTSRVFIITLGIILIIL